MSFVFTFLSMVITCGSDLCEKKSVSSKTEEAMKTLVWYGMFNMILVVLVILFVMDESSLMPHELIAQKPVVLLSPALNFLCLFFALIAYKYVGVAVRNTFANTDGLFFIITLVLYHFVTGNAEHATRMFNPVTLAGLVLVLGSGLIYPNIKGLQDNRSSEGESDSLAVSWNTGGTPKKMMILGIVMSLISAFFDGTQSVVDSVILGDEVADSVDYICVLSLTQVVMGFILWIVLWIINKKPYNPFRKSEKFRFLGQLLSVVSDLLYVLAVSDDALLGIILWSVFPIFDILGARILLKEKLSVKQYLVLLTMIIGGVFISLS